MKKELLKNAKFLNPTEQKKITGGIQLNSQTMGICIINGIQYEWPCNQNCPNGYRPFCSPNDF
jgi:hypothetical protein